MKDLGGRPSDYKEEYIKEVDEYLKLSKDEYEEFHKTRGEKSNGYERLVRVKLPTIIGFSLYIDKPEKTLYAWAKENPLFRKSLDKIKKEQEKRLLDNGLSGDYNPTIAKLILSSNHGYREKSDLTSDGNPLPIINILDVQSN